MTKKALMCCVFLLLASCYAPTEVYGGVGSRQYDASGSSAFERPDVYTLGTSSINDEGLGYDISITSNETSGDNSLQLNSLDLGGKKLWYTRIMPWRVYVGAGASVLYAKATVRGADSDDLGTALYFKAGLGYTVDEWWLGLEYRSLFESDLEAYGQSLDADNDTLFLTVGHSF